MSQDPNHIRQYTAEDFQHYYSGQMTEQEMHALEKAALDDPFLADAMEGYAYSGTAGADINELREKIGRRSAAKVAPVKPKLFSLLLRAAAMLIITGGLAWLLFRKNEPSIDNDLALATKKTATAQPLEKITDTMVSAAPVQQPVVSINIDQQSSQKKLPVSAGTFTIDSISANGSTAVTLSATQSNTWETPDSTKLYRDVAAADKLNSDSKLEGKAPGILTTAQNNAAINLRGRVTDNKGQPVAFASVVDTRNNKGTMTDKDGEFDFVSQDSVALVSVNAVGYKSVNGELRNNLSNALILEPQESSLKEVVVTAAGKKREQDYYAYKSKSRPDNRRISVTNAIPVNGWDHFYKYVDDSLKSINHVDPSFSSIEVLVSFDVDDMGHPIDITAKSACSACEAEAIRIIKYGPAWLLNKKKKKAKATVKF